MKYILITAEGRVMTFYLKALAEEYRIAYGGVIINEVKEEAYVENV